VAETRRQQRQVITRGSQWDTIVPVVWWATALASIVFPQPGGPNISTPRGGSMPICLYNSKWVNGSSTASRTSCFWMSIPPMSAYETSGFSSANQIQHIFLVLTQHPPITGRAVPDFGSGSGRNPALFPNPALAKRPPKVPPKPDSFAGFEKSIFGMLNVRLFRYFLLMLYVLVTLLWHKLLHAYM